MRARTKASDDSMKRGMALSELQMENAKLKETVKQQEKRLEVAQQLTMTLEAEVKESSSASGSSDERLIKERKQRYVVEQLRPGRSPIM